MPLHGLKQAPTLVTDCLACAVVTATSQGSSSLPTCQSALVAQK